MYFSIRKYHRAHCQQHVFINQIKACTKRFIFGTVYALCCCVISNQLYLLCKFTACYNMKLLSTLLISGIILLLIAGCRGCNNHVTTPAPLPVTLTDSVKIDLPLSTFNIPVKYELKNFETWINQVIKGKFLETVINPLNDERDEAKLILTKTGTIQISSNGKELICVVPLQLEAVLLKSRLGKGLTKSADTMITTVNIQLSTPVALDKNWNLVTNFTIDKLKWIKEPVFQVGPFKKNLTRKINDWLKENEGTLTNIIDREINKTVTMAPALSKVWMNLQKPIIIRKKQPNVWVSFACTSIEGRILLGESTITCQTKVLAQTKMITDTTLLPVKNPFPEYRLLKENETVSDIHMYAFTTFEEINDELNSQLKGKTIKAEGYSLDIKSISAYASEAGISVEVVTSRDIKGKLVASGKLEFNTEELQFVIRNFDYSVTSNNTLVNAGDVLLHQQLKDTIASRLVLGMGHLIDSVPQLVENAIATGKSSDKIDLEFDHLEIHSCEIFMEPTGIHFVIHAEATAGIRLKKLKPGKRLRIRNAAKEKIAVTAVNRPT
jgi:Domain of unknown function (DUF4403)